MQRNKLNIIIFLVLIIISFILIAVIYNKMNSETKNIPNSVKNEDTQHDLNINNANYNLNLGSADNLKNKNNEIYNKQTYSADEFFSQSTNYKNNFEENSEKISFQNDNNSAHLRDRLNNEHKNLKNEKNISNKILSFVPFGNKKVKEPEPIYEIPTCFKDTFTEKMMGKVYRIWRKDNFIISKSTYNSKLNEWENTCMGDLLKHSYTTNMNTKIDPYRKDPITNQLLLEPILVNFNRIQIGCFTAKKFLESKVFKKLGFRIYKDIKLTAEIKKFIKKKGFAAPKQYFEKDSSKFIITPIKLLKFKRIIDKSTLETFKCETKGIYVIYFDPISKKETMIGDIDEMNIMFLEIQNFLKNCGEASEYYIDLNFYSPITDKYQ